MISKSTTHQLELQTCEKGSTLLLKHCLPINYNNLSVDLLDTTGRQTGVLVRHKLLAEDSLELTLNQVISGVFQLRLRDGKSFLIKKVIL